MEETYTQEALKADEREAALKDELSRLKENLHQSKANQDAVRRCVYVLRYVIVQYKDLVYPVLLENNIKCTLSCLSLY